MKKFKGTIFFAILVLAVGIFAIQEFKKKEIEETEKETKNNVVLDYKSTDVTSLAVKASEQYYNLRREGTKWSVIEPVQDNADDQAVDSMISGLFAQNIEILDDDGEKPDVKKYGLDAPIAEYNFTFLDGKALKLVVGGVRTYDKGYYLQKDSSPAILVGNSGWESVLNKSLERLRSKKINIEDGQLTHIRLTSRVKGKFSDLDFQLKGAEWLYSKDQKMRIQTAAITEYFNKLHLLRAEGIQTETAEKQDLKVSKFVNPEMTIELTVNASEEKSQKVKIEFKILDDSNALMVSSVNKPIYKISKSKVNDFIQDLGHFRDKKYPFALDPTVATAIEIKKLGSSDTQQYQKTADIWADLKSPSNKIKQDEVKKILEGVSKLEAKEFAGSAKVSGAKSGQILVKGVDGKIQFSINYIEDKKPDMYLATTNLAGESVRVSKPAIDEIVNRKLIEDPPGDVKDEKSK